MDTKQKLVSTLTLITRAKGKILKREVKCLKDAIKAFRKEYETNEIFFDEDEGCSPVCDYNICDNDDVECNITHITFSEDNWVDKVEMVSYYSGREYTIENGAVFGDTDLVVGDLAEYIVNQLGGDRFIKQ